MELKKLVSQMLGSNTYILINNGTAVIIDAGADVEAVKEAVKNLKVEAVLLTHLHFDHVYFLTDYVKEFNCPVYLYNPENVTNPNYTLSQVVGGVSLPTNCYKSLMDVKNLKLKNFNIQCFHTPGHSADSMCFKIDDNLFSGDTLFYYSVGRTDLPTSNTQDMLASLQKLNGLQFSQCFSGHGQSSTLEEQKENIKYFLLEL